MACAIQGLRRLSRQRLRPAAADHVYGYTVKISLRYVFTPESKTERENLLVYLASAALEGHDLKVVVNPNGTVTATYPEMVREGWPPTVTP